MDLISVVTPVFNGAATILDCLKSIGDQTIQAEHIIVDGGSSDRTLEVIGQYWSVVARLVSEQDRGIYDAMNKGIALATGEVVGTLNADDFYTNPDVLARVAEVFKDDRVDSCYGDLVYVDPYDTSRIVRSWRSGPYYDRRFYAGWMPPHPTFFVRRRIYEQHGLFNLSLGSAADYELMLRFLLKHRITTVYIPKVLVKMRAGGVSNVSLRNRLKAHRMDRMAWRVNGIKPWPITLPLKPLSKVGQYFFRG